MTTVNSGYTNYFSSPAAATSAPVNFGPGQLKTEDAPAERERSRVDEARGNERGVNTGYITATRGSQLNITA